MLDERPTALPVDDAFAVEEEEANRYLCCIKPGERKRGGRRRRVDHNWLLYLSENWLRFSASGEGNGAEEGDERESNQIDERKSDEERDLEMSNRVRLVRDD